MGDPGTRAWGLRMELFAFLTCLVPVVLGQVDYTGHMLVRTSPTTEEQMTALSQLREIGLDFWTEPGLGRPLDIRVAPNQVEEIVKFFKNSGLQSSVISSDIQQLIQGAPMVSGPQTLQSVSEGHAMDWENYHTLEDMYSYLDYLEATYDFVSTESIGKSYEGQDMRIIKVCRGGCGDKPAMFYDGGIHAREWVSPAVATYMAMELIENDSQHPDLTEQLDWYILPVMNPDGYRYTRGHDRMWRKTRSSNGGGCVGTDANRNWGFHWNTGGSSNDPCSDTYHGKTAFSEIETQNVRDFILARKDQLKFYNNIHSYSQFVLLPWGWGYEQPDNFDDINRVAQKGNAALYAVHQKTYEVGCIPCMLYIASGGSLDWTLGEVGIPYSYAMELRDTGHYGFILPPDQIIPTGEEVWAFHQSVARDIISEFVPQ